MRAINVCSPRRAPDTKITPYVKTVTEKLFKLKNNNNNAHPFDSLGNPSVFWGVTGHVGAPGGARGEAHECLSGDQPGRYSKFISELGPAQQPASRTPCRLDPRVCLALGVFLSEEQIPVPPAEKARTASRGRGAEPSEALPRFLRADVSPSRPCSRSKSHRGKSGSRFSRGGWWQGRRRGPRPGPAVAVISSMR